MDIDAAVLLGGFPRKAGMTRADLLARNSPIFVEQGRMLNKYASRNVKVVSGVGLLGRHFAYICRSCWLSLILRTPIVSWLPQMPRISPKPPLLR